MLYLAIANFRQFLLRSTQIIFLVFVSSCSFQKEKVGHVTLTKLFEEYDGMKELKSRHMSEVLSKKKAADSLEFRLKNDLTEADSLVRLRARLQLNDHKEWLYYNSEFANSKLFEGVVTQINSGINSYGDKNGYSYILAATLEGTVMYASAKNDITDDVLKELNRTYK